MSYQKRVFYRVYRQLYGKTVPILEEHFTLKKRLPKETGKYNLANLIEHQVDSSIKYLKNFRKYSHGFGLKQSKSLAKQTLNELLYDITLIKSTAQWFTVPFGMSTYKSFPIPSVPFKERKRSSTLTSSTYDAADLMKRMVRVRTESDHPSLNTIACKVPIYELSEEELKCFYYLLDLPISEDGDGPYERKLDFLLMELYGHFDEIFEDDYVLKTRLSEISDEEEHCAKIDRCIGMDSSLADYFVTKEAVLRQNGYERSLELSYEVLSKLISPIIFNTIIVSH